MNKCSINNFEDIGPMAVLSLEYDSTYNFLIFEKETSNWMYRNVESEVMFFS